MRIKSYKARHPANFARRIRRDTSECSAGRTEVRASARKVRSLPPICGGLHAPVTERVVFNKPSHRRVPQRETRGRRGSWLSPSIFSLRCVTDESTARFRVCRSVRDVRGRKGLCRSRRRRPHALSLSRVESAMCLGAGPVGVSCPGRLSPPFRDSGSASPSCVLPAPRWGRPLENKAHRLQ
jgi:hypothetical protein